MSPPQSSPVYSLSKTSEMLRIELAAGPFDAASLRSFKNALDEYWKPSIQHVEIDFSAVTFIDSPMVGALLAIYKRMNNKRPISIIDANPVVKHTLELFHMDEVFELCYRAQV